ncbi:hypothetical protein A1O7_01286 [Cladophialophora yegresii CBS 114405]|uniref:Uncharacterized protein n=1 Tax=Cladophialophora yegresii CBS 114405 TaxID=1182544 RepID=W9WA07_9EURO|nr:uncharacterized protein A1O7_01286 [Cladophialophora yegresii CBS 114405]EXJ64947.1 hypothetical protein A1O7_01286 [Cladophialophora yegresii CBS 114405]
MVEPTAALTVGKPVIEYGFRLASASAEAREAKRYLEQFERELLDLCDLAESTWPYLSNGDRYRVQQVICDAKDSIAAVADANQQSLKDLERAGTLRIYTRVRWTLKDNDAIKLYMPRVQMSYVSLSRCIGTLEAVTRETRATPLRRDGESITDGDMPRFADDRSKRKQRVTIRSRGSTSGRAPNFTAQRPSTAAGAQTPSTSKQRLVVAVDFGMTYTGVSWACDEHQPPQPLYKDWPGSKAGEVHYKIPTLLVYDIMNHGRQRRSYSMIEKLSSWGLLALEDGERYSPNKMNREFFKLFLDDRVLLSQRPEHIDGITHDDVQRWFRDYLGELYQHIESSFESSRPELWQGRVRFVFSVPTAWDPEVVACFKNVISKAGFADGRFQGHTAEVTLTDAQAAAVETVRERRSALKQGEIILVCDAGGGTTDITLLEVASAQDEPLQLDQLDRVNGVVAGAAFIDTDFAEYVAQKLEIINNHCPGLISDIRTVAEMMAASRKFQLNKWSLSAASKRLNVPFKVPIEGLTRGFSHKAADVERGCLIFDPERMAALFDKRLEQIYKILDRQFQSMEQLERTKGRSVRHIVLTGGLGSNLYVKEKLEERYCNSSRVCLRGMTVLTASEPQQAVARGLVVNEMSWIHRESQPQVLRKWISRYSYGFIGKQLFDPNKHLYQDKLDSKNEIARVTGKVWAVNQIIWMIKKGQKLTPNDIMSVPVTRIIDPTKVSRRRRLRFDIVVSDMDGDLPHSTSQPGSERFCTIEADMYKYIDDFDEKKRSWYERGKTHLEAEYELRVNIGPADVTFELWYKDEKLAEQKDLHVAWGDGNSLDMSRRT